MEVNTLPVSGSITSQGLYGLVVSKVRRCSGMLEGEENCDYIRIRFLVRVRLQYGKLIWMLTEDNGITTRISIKCDLVKNIYV